ncbi:MIF4G domain protein [Gregarina niphandrodes]|uniref:MIF4G domain protein n=1 Tax=Gregarina niphandrodes TaxID=110365 RepID=A0A023BD62_GRENI|nr:MIF4G domain protein [Gregarina niphandrodes]EZG87591.1 MIF4G domain protein [Gregarina niphandrodes]|eukprot:XP_011128644.1 MIF4G domain protein [Gregarina niphandrodes]
MTNPASEENKSTTPFQFDASAPSFVPRAQRAVPSPISAEPAELSRSFSWAQRAKHGGTAATPTSGLGATLKSKSVVDKKGADKHSTDKHSTDKHSTDKHGADKHVADKTLSDKTLSDKTLSDKTLSDKTLSDKTVSDKTVSDKNEKKSTEKRSNDKRSMDKRSVDRKSNERRSNDRRPAEKKAEDKAEMTGLESEAAAASSVGSTRQTMAEIIRPPVTLAKLDDKLAAAKLATAKAEQGKKKAAADKAAADKAAADKAAADKATVDKAAAEKATADKAAAADKTTAAGKSGAADKLSADKLSADKSVADKSVGSSEKTQPASEDLDERVVVAAAKEDASTVRDAAKEIPAKEPSTPTAGRWNAAARDGMKRTESRTESRAESRAEVRTEVRGVEGRGEGVRRAGKLAAVAAATEPARYSYGVESMLELRGLPECQTLKVKPGMEWILASTGASGDRSLNTLLEYRSSRNTESGKFQVPAAIARKVPSSTGGQDDWSRRKKEELMRTSSAQKSLAHATSRASLPEVPEDSWQVQQQKAKDAGDRGVKVIRRLRAQLNKMTPKTYDSIFKAILDIGIDNVSEAEAFVNIIFEKAITNHNYIDMYADLCGSLELELQQRGVFCSANKDGPDFKRLLIQTCQNTFQLYLGTDFVAPETADEEEAFELLLNHKKKMKGNLMFVACLAQSQLVQPKILLLILNQTLDTRKSLQLEALASFLPSCAPAIAETKRAPAFFQYLERCKEAACDDNIEQRVRFLLQDAIEQIEKMGLNQRPQQ